MPRLRPNSKTDSIDEQQARGYPRACCFVHRIITRCAAGQWNGFCRQGKVQRGNNKSERSKGVESNRCRTAAARMMKIKMIRRPQNPFRSDVPPAVLFRSEGQGNKGGLDFGGGCGESALCEFGAAPAFSAEGLMQRPGEGPRIGTGCAEGVAEVPLLP